RHVRTRARRALLSAVPEGRARDAGRGLFEIGMTRDDRGVLAAHLDDDRLRPRLGEPPVEIEADLLRAREDDPVETLVEERIAELAAPAGDELEDAGR